MNSTFKVVTLRDIIDLVLSGKLNPDPISQRPTTSVSPKKSRGIISAISIGYGVGMITVRNIENDEEMQKVYPGVHYIVIDGGHRVRALVEFYTNKFSNDEKHFKDLSVKEQKDFLAIEIAMESIICTSVEAIHIFRTRNKTTDVNFMEMIMCDDQSQICREVRSRTKYYREYQNAVHPAFAVSRQQGGDWKPECFDSEMNPRRKWDEYVFIAILKAIGGGNVDAGQREMEELVAEEYKSKNKVSKRVFAIVDRFLSDVRDFRFSRGKKLNGADFAAFQLVWFGLYEQNSEFVINDMELFKTEFMNVYTKLTGTSDTSYNNKIVNIGDEDNQELVNLKEYVRTRSKNFSNSQDQRTCAKFFLNEMPKKTTQYGVLFRDNVRSLNTKQREEQLALQKYKCALDGEHLTLEESVWGHDVSWADGGKLWNGKVVRRGHNTAMGQLTLDEYRLILKLRKEKAVA